MIKVLSFLDLFKLPSDFIWVVQPWVLILLVLEAFPIELVHHFFLQLFGPTPIPLLSAELPL